MSLLLAIIIPMMVASSALVNNNSDARVNRTGWCDGQGCMTVSPLMLLPERFQVLVLDLVPKRKAALLNEEL
jgi:hypothetical protein